MYDWMQKAVDAVHLAGNGVGFGLPDWLAAKGRQVVDGEDATTAAANVAANTARAKDNLGAVGDVITGVGNVAGAVRGGALVKSALKAVPAFLAAAPAAEAATGNAFRTELAARQALNPSPLAVAARAVTTPKVLATGIAGAAAAGIANAGRTGLQDPAAAAIAASSPIAGGPSFAELSNRANAAEAAGVAANGGLPAGTLGPPPTDGPENAFSHILDNFSGAQGGLSLHQLAILAQAQAHSRSPLYGYQKKPQTATDKANEQLNAINDAMWLKTEGEIKAMPAGADRDKRYADELEKHRQRVESAAKINTQSEAMGRLLGGSPPAMAD